MTGVDNNAFGTALVMTSGHDNNICGKQAFNSDTSGSDNIAIGSYALRLQTTGNQNIGIGSNALYNNSLYSANVAIGYLALTTATSTSEETALGWKALTNDACGQSSNAFICANTAIGYNALQGNTYGVSNTSIGWSALTANTTGSNNVGIGGGVLIANTTGSNNVGIGNGNTLLANTSGSYNIGIGASALKNNTSGQFNVAIGASDNSLNGPLNNNTTGQYNIVLGQRALNNSTTGSFNIALGGFALGVNTGPTNAVAIGYRAAFGGTGNGAAYSNQGETVVGYQAGQLFQTGSDYNTLFGYESGNGITTGARNVLIGHSTISASQNQVTTGSNNIAIGNDVAVASSTLSNQLDIGNFIYGTGLSGTGATVSPGNIGIGTSTPYSRLTLWGADTAAGTAALTIANSASTTEFQVFDNGNATLAGTLTQNSDQRLKTNVQSLDASSSLAAINALNPVTFNWIDPAKGVTPQLGFIAQQVLPIFPNLISTTSATDLTPDGTLGLNYIGFIAPIVKSIQQLAQEIANFADSITTKELTFTRATGDELDVKKLCVGATCVTEDQLKTMSVVKITWSLPRAAIL